MNQWQREVQESLLDSEEEALKALERQYASALNQIGQNIKLFQADINMLNEAVNTEGLDDASRQILLSQAQSKIYQKNFQENLQRQISGILDQMHSKNYATIQSYLRNTYEDSFLGTMYDIAQQGMPVIMPINQAAATRAILTDTKVSGGYYDRLGVDVDHLKETIRDTISRGIATSAPYSEIARNINNVSRSGLYNAQRIARTEGHRIQNTAARDAAEDAVAHGADLVKIWDATLDAKTRESHRLVDGEVRELNEKFSNGLDRPGDPAGSAEEVINCRCAEIHKPRWDVDGGFVKMDNFTGELVQFDTAQNYEEFKERYWSKENQQYMEYVQDLESKYGTKDLERLRESMSDQEYQHFHRLESASPMWKPTISSPISQRNNAAGRPTAIAQFDVELNNRQIALLNNLPEYNSSVIVAKNEASMTDLSALTAKTGCEYAMFTRGSQRLIIRGNSHSVDVNIDKANELMQNGYRWSGHTHPGTDFNCLIASGDDYEILKAFGQVQSVTYNSVGQYMVYELEQ